MIITGLKNILLRLCGIATAVALSATALVSCSGDTPDLPAGSEEPAGMMSIGFRVAAPAPMAASDGDINPTGNVHNGGYEDGTTLESTIDFASYNYRVYFFDSEDNYITEWSHVAEMHVLAGANNGYWLYTLKGKVPDKLKNHSTFSVMVLANWPDYPEYHNIDLTGKTIDQVVSETWAQFKAFESYRLSLENGNLIPFYGLKKYENVTFQENSTRELEPAINLLRAVAKVEVIVDLSNFPADVKLDDANPPLIRGINPSGYCGTKSTIGEGTAWDSDYINDLHMPFDNNANHTAAYSNTKPMLEVTPEGSTTERKWIAYLPEYRNIGTTSALPASHIELNLKQETEQDGQTVTVPISTYWLEFANYDTNGYPDLNNRFDIRRNDLYRFTVNADLHTIRFKLEVENWIFGGRHEFDM